MIKLSTEWLSVCGGCHVSVVDLHEKIFNVFKTIDICRSPVLTDIKSFPDADLGILSGAIRSKHDRELADKMRKSCKSLIAFGTCAVFGGISGAGSVHTKDEIFDAVYINNKTTITNTVPGNGVPNLEDTVLPLDSVTDVDLYLPGCPPHPEFIFRALQFLLKEKPRHTDHQTVCGRCGRDMVKTNETSLKKSFEGIPHKHICFLSQGYLCFGPVTLDRCLSPCPRHGIICTGCAGPEIRILQEPNIDIRTEMAERISKLTSIKKEDVIQEIEKFSKTHYAYAMASPMIAKKPTFLIKKWMQHLTEVQ